MIVIFYTNQRVDFFNRQSLTFLFAKNMQRLAVPCPGLRHAPVAQSSRLFWTRCSVRNRNAPLSPAPVRRTRWSTSPAVFFWTWGIVCNRNAPLSSRPGSWHAPVD